MLTTNIATMMQTDAIRRQRDTLLRLLEDAQ